MISPITMKRLDASGYATDKSEIYLQNYAEHFESIVDKEVKLLELGIHSGGSLLLWRDYFKRGNIVGRDIKPVHFDDPTGRIRVYQGRQDDTALLDRICNETAPDGFDVIVDDCSHIGELTSISFWYLFDKHLKPGGMYVIEDWGTGYWDMWPDGRRYKPKSCLGITTRLRLLLEMLMEKDSVQRISKLKNMMGVLRNRLYKRKFRSHQFGMVGFIKELVDECAMGDITYPGRGISPQRPSKFKKMVIVKGQVFITKA